MPAGELPKLGEALAQAKERFGLPAATRGVSCSMGIENDVVVGPSSIEVNRRKRRAKTDRIDGEHLLTKLMRYRAGERGGSVVRVPSVAEEDARMVGLGGGARHRVLSKLARLPQPRHCP